MDAFLSGTRETIFDVAIEMIATVGYENMSMRDLAVMVGIKAASIYNHFTGKQEILDCIYKYYISHFFDNRCKLDEAKRIMETGSKEDIFKSIIFTFETSDEKKYRRMLLTTKIVCMRIFNDDQANQIFLNLICAESALHVREVLSYGVSTGRIKPFDIETFADFMIGQVYFMGIKAYASPNYVTRQLDEEVRIHKMLMEFIPINEQNE